MNINQATLERYVSRSDASTYINMMTKLVPFRYVQSSEPTLSGRMCCCKRKTFKSDDIIEKLEEYIASKTLYGNASSSKPHKRRLLKLTKEINHGTLKTSN